MKIQTIAMKTVTIDETTYIQNSLIIEKAFAESGFKFFNRYDPILGMIFYMPAEVKDQYIEQVSHRIIEEILNTESVA